MIILTKSILISIQPKWVEKILNGEKTIEIRKTMPKCELPIDVYIYCTKDKAYLNLINRGGFLTRMLVAKFTLNKVEEIEPKVQFKLSGAYCTYRMEKLATTTLLEKSCLSFEELDLYLNWNTGYAWHIDNLEIFDKPIELDSKPPMSWCYIER